MIKVASLFSQAISAAGAIVVMDRGYNDFRLFANWCARGVFFVTRMKEETVYEMMEYGILAKHLPHGDGYRRWHASLSCQSPMPCVLELLAAKSRRMCAIAMIRHIGGSYIS